MAAAVRVGSSSSSSGGFLLRCDAGGERLEIALLEPAFDQAKDTPAGCRPVSRA
jgi:hypothetical protein